MSSIQLPLTLDSTRNFQAFLSGLEDQKVRHGIRAQKNVDARVAQVVDLVEDPDVLQKAGAIVSELQKLQGQAASITVLAPPAAQPAAARMAAIKASGQDLHDFLVKKYPQGLELLREYGEMAYPEMALNGTIGVTVSIAANAGAVVNAAVWANVAVATQAVVAAAAVAVVAVVVT
eukprot:TRINITY_DN9009_c0_g2_i1.p1 TRINITY_DN9009_c0_g2~~TRINITY_DN9009_c0_g2_i1.p1  ORF type:complete len:194 (+),score=4.16 TRINITY_DN9009_c0_g2_i1:56-583(+)